MAAIEKPTPINEEEQVLCQFCNNNRSFEKNKGILRHHQSAHNGQAFDLAEAESKTRKYNAERTEIYLKKLLVQVNLV